MWINMKVSITAQQLLTAYRELYPLESRTGDALRIHGSWLERFNKESHAAIGTGNKNWCGKNTRALFRVLGIKRPTTLAGMHAALAAYETMEKTAITTKEQAYDKAVEWQQWQSEQSLSYVELVEWQEYFEELGKRFDLTEEFQENGIL